MPQSPKTDLCIKCGQSTTFKASFPGSIPVIAVTVAGLARLANDKATHLVLTRAVEKYGEGVLADAVREDVGGFELLLPLCPSCVSVKAGPPPYVTDMPPWQVYEFVTKR